jgi:integrase
MMGPILDMRAGEIVSRQVRDLDDDGHVIWTKSKTEAGRRRLRIHYAPLSAYLKRLAQGRKSEAWLFPARSASGHRYRDWVREWVQRICRETGVMIVSAHSMRGLHSSLATEEGETSAAIAKALGHGNPRVTEQSYIRPESLRGARQARVLRAIKGG